MNNILTTTDVTTMNGQNRTIDIVNAGLQKRRSAEKRFQLYGKISIVIGLIFLLLLFVSILIKGLPAFQQTYMQLDVTLEAAEIDPEGKADPEVLGAADYTTVVKSGLLKMFPDVSDRRGKRDLNALLSSGASFQLRDMVLKNPEMLGKTHSVWFLVDDKLDSYIKGYFKSTMAEADRPLNDQQLKWVKQLQAEKRIEKRFNSGFFKTGDSRDPELAGIRGAAAGSLFTLLVTLALSFPIGVAAAIYLEEFAPKNRFTDFIEVNINNLAAVPSIVFGLLGLAVFINFFGLPRSAPLVGGLVLTLMTLPVIIIAGRAALKSVPPSIREAALGIGASPLQSIMYHVLPLALPGMLTGTIIGMARALGETAPLLMIGMVAFIADVPGSINDPATVLPVQIYLWADSPERAFAERTSAAIIILLAFLITMNAIAVYLRQKFERRW